MAILQVGFPRSGNFWLHRVLDGLLREAGRETRSFVSGHPIHAEAQTWTDLGGPDRANMDVLDIAPAGCRFRIGRRFSEDVSDVGAYVRRASHVSTHSPWNAGSSAVLPLFERVVYVVRDPRDAVVSLANYNLTPYMRDAVQAPEAGPAEFVERRLERLTAAWTRHVAGYLQHLAELPLHVVFFERLVLDFDREVERLARHAELDVSAAGRRRVAQETSFESLRTGAPEHVREGGTRHGRGVLTAEQDRRARGIAGPLLELLGYAADGGGTLPELPGSVAPAVLADALARAAAAAD